MTKDRVFAADWLYPSSPTDPLVGERVFYVGASKETIVDWLIQYRGAYQEDNKLFLANPYKPQPFDPNVVTDVTVWRELDDTEAAAYLSIPRQPTAIVATAVDLWRDGVGIEKHLLPGWQG